MIRLREGDSGLSETERFVLSGVLVVVAILTTLDVIEDWQDGSPISHIIPEVSIIVAMVGITLYLLRNLLKSRQALIESAQTEIRDAKERANSWRSKAENLRQGVTDAISSQFQDWGLSPAEQEVSFLLLKGLSIQEIAQVRETSERTVRQQASEVYKKSRLSGRAQLSAFFLEDLFER